jgi:thiol-disulfide isomerase/thioredoxin
MILFKKKHFLFILIMFFSVSSLTAHALNQFVLTDMEGKVHRLNQYKGKWVIVNYWATWCPPCLEEIPDLVALYDGRKDKDVMVIGVVFEYKTVKEVTDYIDDMLMSYPTVLGGDHVTKQIGSAEVMPTTYIYNPRGKLVKVKKGIVSRQYLETIVNE